MATRASIRRRQTLSPLAGIHQVSLKGGAVVRGEAHLHPLCCRLAAHTHGHCAWRAGERTEDGCWWVFDRFWSVGGLLHPGRSPSTLIRPCVHTITANPQTVCSSSRDRGIRP